MPRIVVTTNVEDESQGTVLLSERVAPADLESEHFSAQLVERVGWAVLDAEGIEHDESPRAQVPTAAA